jgi:quinol-cytochrome oxidoreductase complex cytochrome b subunit
MAIKHSTFTSFLLHIHPRKVNEQTLIFTRTFGLGGINALLFVILAVTGLLLRFAYVPTPDQAYDSILSLQNNSLFGKLIRNLHHWSAMLMVITSFLHLLRVFYSNSIYYERKKTWYYGLILFAIVLAFNFTGYLLPWDQLSFWAVTIMTNIVSYIPIIGEGLARLIRGGEMVNGNTLLNFYTFHTALLPLLFVVFMVLHFWLIRKAKGVTSTASTEKKMVDVNPDLISKEILMGLVLIAVLLITAMFFDAPLLDKANPLVSPNPSKSPWYFMGIQELLIHLHPFFSTLIVPVILIALFVYIPNNKIDKDKVGVWFYSPKAKKMILYSIIFSAIITMSLIFAFEYNLHPLVWNLPLYISTGFIPLFLYLIPLAVFAFLLKWKFKADKMEIYQIIFTFILTSYLLMSIVGVWFRGESMHLIF